MCVLSHRHLFGPRASFPSVPGSFALPESWFLGFSPIGIFEFRRHSDNSTLWNRRLYGFKVARDSFPCVIAVQFFQAMRLLLASRLDRVQGFERFPLDVAAPRFRGLRARVRFRCLSGPIVPVFPDCRGTFTHCPCSRGLPVLSCFPRSPFLVHQATPAVSRFTVGRRGLSTLQLSPAAQPFLGVIATSGSIRLSDGVTTRWFPTVPSFPAPALFPSAT